MSHKLIYTSAPKGLAANKTGFCTVAKDVALPANLEREMESHSGYRWLGDPGDPLNPVAYIHYKLRVAGKPVHLLSRIGDSGKDYTGRSNKLACHLALSPAELPDGGPGWLLGQRGVLPTEWDGNLDGNLQVNIPLGGSDRPSCSGWKTKTGDAGWGGVLAQAIADNQKQPVWVIYNKQDDLLSLFRESLSLLPESLRWNVTFTTFFTKLPPGMECRWRGAVAGTEAETLARRSGHVIDLTTTLGSVDGVHQGEYIDAARTGRKLQLKKQAAAPRQSVEVPDDYALEASLRKEEGKPSPAAPPDRRSSPKGAPPPMPTPVSSSPKGKSTPRRTPGGRRLTTPLLPRSPSGQESNGILPIILALIGLFLFVVAGVIWHFRPWASDTASNTSGAASQTEDEPTAGQQAEKAAAEKAAAEKAAAEKAAAEKAAAEKAAAEKAAAEKAAAEKAAAEKAAAGNGTAENGTAENGTAEKAAAEKAAAGNGTAENGTAENGTAENGTAENGTAENGTAENGTAENGTAENGTAENGTAENGTAENGTAENGTAENGTAENGTAENGTAENGTTGNGTAENSFEERFLTKLRDAILQNHPLIPFVKLDDEKPFEAIFRGSEFKNAQNEIAWPQDMPNDQHDFEERLESSLRIEFFPPLEKKAQPVTAVHKNNTNGEGELTWTGKIESRPTVEIKFKSDGWNVSENDPQRGGTLTFKWKTKKNNLKKIARSRVLKLYFKNKPAKALFIPLTDQGNPPQSWIPRKKLMLSQQGKRVPEISWAVFTKKQYGIPEGKSLWVKFSSGNSLKPIEPSSPTWEITNQDESHPFQWKISKKSDPYKSSLPPGTPFPLTAVEVEFNFKIGLATKASRDKKRNEITFRAEAADGKLQCDLNGDGKWQLPTSFFPSLEENGRHYDFIRKVDFKSQKKDGKKHTYWEFRYKNINRKNLFVHPKDKEIYKLIQVIAKDDWAKNLDWGKDIDPHVWHTLVHGQTWKEGPEGKEGKWVSGNGGLNRKVFAYQTALKNIGREVHSKTVLPAEAAAQSTTPKVQPEPHKNSMRFTFHYILPLPEDSINEKKDLKIYLRSHDFTKSK